MRLALLVCLFMGSSSGLAQGLTPSKSARREPGVSFELYVEQMRLFSTGKNITEDQPSAFDSSVKFEKAILPSAPAWASEEQLLELFRYVRDNRFLVQSQRPGFLRRSSWLFPDDGCFARASLAVRNLLLRSVPVPMKVFAFGDLSMESPNIGSGVVSWWYHVAPVVELRGQKYVLDPAMESRHPLPLAQWLAHMSDRPGALRVAICGSGTYMPGDSCAQVTDGREVTAEADQHLFLDAEWDRLLELHRQPERELGDYPPWQESSFLAH